MGAMPHFGGRDRARAALERFLTGEPGESAELPPLEALEESGLAAYASTCPGGGGLRRALLNASARHIAVKAEVQRLLRAWQDAGIEAMLFKGFHLAEFVYPSPGGRLYSDVDLLIEQRDALEAAAVAVRAGWVETWHAQRRSSAHGTRGPRYYGHEVIQLLHPRIGIQVDVHRRLVHNNHNRIRRYTSQERITRMTWEASHLVSWDGVYVRLPQPLDAVLVGLVLNRCWSPEDFELRSHDYLDFRFLVEKYGLDLEGLERRAAELGCPRTFELFLERCDPFRRRCVLSKPTSLELQRWNLLIASERGNRYLERGWMAANEWPREIFAAVGQLPGAVRVLSAVARLGGPREAARAMAARGEREPAPQAGVERELGAAEWLRLRRAVHRALRILGHGSYLGIPGAASKRDLEAVALLAALQRRHWPATLEWSPSAGRDDARPHLVLGGKPLNLSGTLLARKRQAPGEGAGVRAGRRQTG